LFLLLLLLLLANMSDFWKRKMKTYFTRIDFDHDGSITQKDFEGMAARFAEKKNLAPNVAADLKNKLLEIWEKYLKQVASGQSLTLDVFIAALQKQNKDDLKKTVAGPLPLFFAAVDGNNDGLIQIDEFELFFAIIGLDAKLADTSFKAIDSNNDGQISKDEFIDAGTEFFVGEDAKSPSALFWGTLV
jgi:Ca2+-binding EF-hand superfamily protein